MVGKSKSLRLLQVLELLSSQPGISMSDLVRELGLSERTIYRYLDTLSSEMNVPLYHRAGGYHLNGKAFLGPLNFTSEELFVTALALSTTPAASTKTFAEYAKSAFRKIESAVSTGAIETVQPWLEHSTVQKSPYCPNELPDMLEKILNSTVVGKQLKIDYYSARSAREKEMVFEPYAIAFRRHAWYVAGFSREHRKVIQLKMVRIRSISETGVKFIPPADFSVDDFYARSWEVWSGDTETEVQVRFSAKVAPIVKETRRHPTQRIEDQPDGSIIFSVRVDGSTEIGFWILGWGSEAEVLAPQVLRDHIASCARQMAQIYNKSFAKVSEY